MQNSRPGSDPYYLSYGSGMQEAALPGPVDALILDLLEWIGPGSKPYAEVMAAWRTSCPRLPVWEDANERGFIGRHSERGVGAFIVVTALGREHLAKHRGVRFIT
jgi:hypothetical protein